MNSDSKLEEIKKTCASAEFKCMLKPGLAKQSLSEVNKSEILKRRAGKNRMAKLRTLPEK